MRRLGRSTLNAVTVLSLVLCVATCVLWARAEPMPRISVGYDDDGWKVEGAVAVRTRNQILLGPIADKGSAFQLAGFGYERRVYSDPHLSGISVTYRVPLARLLTASAVLPVLMAALRIVRPGKPRHGCCSKCGYDLTGNVSGVCPECGRQGFRT